MKPDVGDVYIHNKKHIVLMITRHFLKPNDGEMFDWYDVLVLAGPSELGQTIADLPELVFIIAYNRLL